MNEIRNDQISPSNISASQIFILAGVLVLPDGTEMEIAHLEIEQPMVEVQDANGMTIQMRTDPTKPVRVIVR